MKTHGEYDYLQDKERWVQKKINLDNNYSWISRLHNCEKIHFCSLSHPVCATCYGKLCKVIQLTHPLFVNYSDYAFLCHFCLLFHNFLSQFKTTAFYRTKNAIDCKMQNYCMYLWGNWIKNPNTQGREFSMGLHIQSWLTNVRAHQKQNPAQRKGQQGNATLDLVGRSSNSLLSFVSGGDHHAGVWSEVQLQVWSREAQSGDTVYLLNYLLCIGVQLLYNVVLVPAV